MDISTHALQYFCVLAEELHFGAAAKRLSISSPSLSQQISRLERTTGVRLFERGPRGVALTDGGAALLPHARRVRDAHEDVVAWVRSMHAVDQGVLRIGLVAAGAGELTTAILVATMQHLPAVRLEMRRLGFFDADEELLAGRVDAVFAPGPRQGGEQRVRTIPLWTEERVLVVPARHRLAGAASISIDEVRDETFLTASGGDPATVDWWIADPRPDGSHPRRGPVADDIEGLLELCAAGAGVNIAGASAASRYRRDDIVFVPVRDIPPAQIVLTTLATTTNPAVLEFERAATDVAGRWHAVAGAVADGGLAS